MLHRLQSEMGNLCPRLLAGRIELAAIQVGPHLVGAAAHAETAEVVLRVLKADYNLVEFAARHLKGASTHLPPGQALETVKSSVAAIRERRRLPARDRIAGFLGEVSFHHNYRRSSHSEAFMALVLSAVGDRRGRLSSDADNESAIEAYNGQVVGDRSV
jgi:hypothetical protein